MAVVLDWRVLPGFLATVCFLGWVRHLPEGPWALLYDDGVWTSIVHRWCGGARLYAELWDNKPPGFYLWLRPFCWVEPAASLSVSAEVVLFWAPLLTVVAAAVALLSRAFELNGVQASTLGCASVLISWFGRMGEFFPTEALAAAFATLALAFWAYGRRYAAPWASTAVILALCAAVLSNWKFASFAPVYLSIRPLGVRRAIRDGAWALLFVVFVLGATVGWDPVAYSAMLDGLRPEHSPRLTPFARWDLMMKHSLFGWRSGLLDFLKTPLLVLIPGATPVFRMNVALSGAVALTLLFGLRARELLLTLGMTLLAVYSTGLIWEHTFVQLFPFAVVLIALLLTCWPSRAQLLTAGTALWCLTMLVAASSEENPYGTWRSREVLQISRDHAEVYTAQLAGRPWVSLLKNGPPPLLVPGVSPPRNRLFHNYCEYFPRWAADEIAHWVQRGGVRVALDTRLGGKCWTAPSLELVRAQCRRAAVRALPTTEFYDCPGTDGRAAPAPSHSTAASP